MFCPVVQGKSMTLRRYSAAPGLSMVEEEHLVRVGLA